MTDSFKEASRDWASSHASSLAPFTRGRALSTLLVSLLACAAVAGVACGSGDSNRGKLLSSASATELKATLDRVEQRVNDGDCDGAEAQASALRQQIGSLDRSLDVRLRASLSSSAARLETLVSDRCQPAVTTPPPAVTQPPPTEPKMKPPRKPEKREREPKKPEQPKEPVPPNGGGALPDGGVPPGEEGKNEGN